MDFAQLACTNEEPDKWVERLVDAGKTRGLEVVLFAAVRYLGVKKSMWERAFSVLPPADAVKDRDKATVLSKFERSFKEYAREDVPLRMPRRDFQAILRSNPYEEDLVKYCKIVSFLQKRRLAFAITTQRVQAWRDPRQNPKSNQVLAAIAAFFGERVEFALIEYCVVLDVAETLFRRALVPLSTLLLPGPEASAAAAVNDDDAPDNGDSEQSSSSSSTQTMDITSSESSGTSRQTLAGAEDVTLELPPTPVASARTHVPASSALLRSTSSSSQGGTASSGTFIRIHHKSLSLSSSGHK